MYDQNSGPCDRMARCASSCATTYSSTALGANTSVQLIRIEPLGPQEPQPVFMSPTRIVRGLRVRPRSQAERASRLTRIMTAAA